MKVLLTGATGFIGANLVRALIDRGDEVHCVIRKPNICIEGLDVYTHTIPLLDHPAEVEKLSRVMQGCSVVYHLAGMFDPSPGGLERMVNLHVYGTRGLLRAAEKAKVAAEKAKEAAEVAAAASSSMKKQHRISLTDSSC